jgi:hypothetical protein
MTEEKRAFLDNNVQKVFNDDQKVKTNESSLENLNPYEYKCMMNYKG